MKSRTRAATLAVGTEITDGQIVDRNSAWISKKLTDAGVEVIEHRAVADDRPEIEKALSDLASRVDLLFVTGGLGPTSDDFTRELLAKFCGKEMIFDEGSWAHIEQRFASRGLQAKPIQRQQCFFPEGARILKNNAGTANAFSFEHVVGGHSIRVYAMPGPPLEIATVWADHLTEEVEAFTPAALREDLHLIRTLGAGESAIAEIVEPIIVGSGLKVGYRAHVPYVEVKLWAKRSETVKAKAVIAAVEKAISPFIVGYGNEDLADSVLNAVSAGRSVLIRDEASKGLFEERLMERIRGVGTRPVAGRLTVVSSLLGEPLESAGSTVDIEIRIAELEGEKTWSLGVKKTGELPRELEVKPTALYNFGTERGRRYLCEAVFQKLASLGL